MRGLVLALLCWWICSWSVISHLWFPCKTLLVQMVLPARPQLRKQAKEGYRVLVLIFKCQELFGGCPND